MSPQPIDVLLAEIDTEAAAHLAAQAEGTLMVGITINGERHIRRYRSEGAELAEMPSDDSIYEIGMRSPAIALTCRGNGWSQPWRLDASDFPG